MESFYRTHAYLVEHTNAPVRRDLMDEIDWENLLLKIIPFHSFHSGNNCTTDRIDSTKVSF